MCAHTNQSVLRLVRPAVRLCCRLGPCCTYHGSSSLDSFVDVCSTKKSLQKLQDNCLHICVRSWCWRLSADNVQSTFRLKQLELSRTELSDLSAQQVSFQGQSSLMLHHMLILRETSVHARMWLVSIGCPAAHTQPSENIAVKQRHQSFRYCQMYVQLSMM